MYSGLKASILFEERVELPDRVERIVSLSPAITDTLVMLGLRDKIVGVSAFCPAYVREVKGLPIVGSYLDVKWSLLEELKPDIVLLGLGVQSSIARELLGRGYHVYTLPLPTSVAGILDNTLRIGFATNSYSSALKIYLESIKQLAKIMEKTMEKPRVYVEVWVGEPRTIGYTSFIHDAVTIAGYENIYGWNSEPYPVPDYKYVLNEEPDYVIIAREVYAPPINMILEKNGLDKLEAVRKGKLIVLDVSRPLAHPSPRIIDTIEYLNSVKTYDG